MSGTEDLISKWTTQIQELQADAENMSAGAVRNGILQKIALLQKAIDTAETVMPTRTSTDTALAHRSRGT